MKLKPELKAEWLDRKGRLRYDDGWMFQMTSSAGHIRGDDMRISTKGAEESIAVDDTYANFYNSVFPAVYRIQDLDWFTPVSDEPHAILLFATPIGEPDGSVIFRVDKHEQLCIHARNVSVTDAMITFAREVLPTLPAKIKETWDERERLTAAGKPWPYTEPLKRKRKTRQA